MKSTGFVVTVGLVGLVVGGAAACAAAAPLPWAIGIALLVAAAATSFASDRFGSLALVGVWALGACAISLTGSGPGDVSSPLSVLRDVASSSVPWLLVGCCGIACAINVAG